jgi:hypothetical protein
LNTPIHTAVSFLSLRCSLLATYLLLQPLLVGSKYDPFFRQKCTALAKSMDAAGDIAAALQQLLQQQQNAVAAAGCGSTPQMTAHFSEDAKSRFYQLLQVRFNSLVCDKLAAGL